MSWTPFKMVTVESFNWQDIWKIRDSYLGPHSHTTYSVAILYFYLSQLAFLTEIYLCKKEKKFFISTVNGR